MPQRIEAHAVAGDAGALEHVAAGTRRIKRVVILHELDVVADDRRRAEIANHGRGPVEVGPRRRIGVAQGEVGRDGGAGLHRDLLRLGRKAAPRDRYLIIARHHIDGLIFSTGRVDHEGHRLVGALEIDLGGRERPGGRDRSAHRAGARDGGFERGGRRACDQKQKTGNAGIAATRHGVSSSACALMLLRQVIIASSTAAVLVPSWRGVPAILFRHGRREHDPIIPVQAGIQ